MLGSITCDTDISEIIKEEDVKGNLDELKNITENFYREIRNFIESEEQSGCLSLEAYNLDGQSQLQDSTELMAENLTIKDVSSTFEESVMTLLQEQRRKEISKLIEKVIEKIEELEKQLFEVETRIRNLSPIDNLNYNSEMFALNGQRNMLDTQIRGYKDKLNTLEGML